VLLILLMAITAGAFALTRSTAATARELRRRDGEILYARARNQLDVQETSAAVENLRRALATDPMHREYRLALARALIENGEAGEARALLGALRAERPEDVDVSLALARLEAAEERWEDAVQHYQHTLATLWSADQLHERRTIRIELIEGLLARGDRRRALSELLILSAGLPDDPDMQIAAGRMYLAAGDPLRAEEHFDRVLARAADHPHALAGAGEAAFAQADYARARRLLRQAPVDDPRVVDLLAVTDLVLSRDPLVPRITLAERRRRLAAILAHVLPAVDGCASSAAGSALQSDTDFAALRGALTAISGEGPAARPPRLGPEQIDEAFEIAYRAQLKATQVCELQSPMDRAVLLIGARHEFE
jgi:tetratricopeptide (TPR) repeat protein